MATKEKSLKNLVTYLLTPEDTTASMISGRYQVEVEMAEKWYGRLKASVWIVAPLAIVMLMNVVQ